MKSLFARFVKEEEGQDLIEYALLAALIAIAAIGVLRNIAGGTNNIFQTVNNAVQTAS